MTEHFNKLTPAEAERLAVLAEECGEVIQIVGKILRHGYESRNPVRNVYVTNREQLAMELGDLTFSIHDMLDCDVDEGITNTSINTKGVRRAPYMHHQEEQ